VVNKPASWMVNLELGVEKGPGDLALFLLHLSHIFYNNKSYVFLSLYEKVGLQNTL
tara:strand:- start:348 stop:515 length:168 start_codon:yes stop_codon:yes gene_type:complete